MSSYNTYIKSLTDDLIIKLTDGFNTNNGQCTQNKLVSQVSEIYIGPGFFGPTCSISSIQDIDTSSGSKVCSDINNRMINMNSEERIKLLTNILDQLFLDSKYKNVPSTFKQTCKEKIIELLGNLSGNVNSTCSQSIYLDQNQKIYLLGKIECKNSKLEFSQNAIVQQYMKCIVGPMFDSLNTDLLLQTLYNENPNKDCIYDKILVKGCDGTKRIFKVNILSNATGTGTCPYINNQNVEETCNKIECQVSDWDEWSDCIEGKQSRQRRIIKQGENCPNFLETRDCTIVINRGDITNTNNNTSIKFKSYNWFVLGIDKMEKKQRIIFYVFLSFLLLVLIYSLI